MSEMPVLARSALNGMMRGLLTSLYDLVGFANTCISNTKWWMFRADAAPSVSAEIRARIQFFPAQGADGYLFHKDHDIIEQLASVIRFRNHQLEAWSGVLNKRTQWCDSHGAVFRELIIPEKHVVYSDKLPPSIRISSQRPVQQLLSYVDPSIRERMLYPVEELKAARVDQPTFFKTDTHWCNYGAYIGYRVLVDSLRSEIDIEPFPSESLEFVEKKYTGDLGVRFNDEREETSRFLLVPSPPSPVYQNNNFGRGAVHVYDGADPTLPRCVMFRDSFANSLMPLLVKNFSRIVAVSSISYFYDLLEQERPDVVLSITIERFLSTFGQGNAIELPQDLLTSPSFFSYCGTDLETIRNAGRSPDAESDAPA